ncbi:lectin C-type domain protein [Ostertagia ostertagi]
MFVLPLALLLLPFAVADCPIGTTYHPDFNRCYLFVAEPQPFGLAEDACVSNRGHIVSVMNGFENAMLAESAVAQNLKSPFFVGMNKLQGNWSNSDGSAYTYTNWSPGPPGWWLDVDFLLQSFSIHLCHTRRCSSGFHLPNVCYTYVSSACTSTRPLRFGMDILPGYGFLLSNNFFWATFDNAEEICVSEGGHLTSIHSTEENSFVIEIAESGNDYGDSNELTWMGLRQADYPTKTDWTWTDGTPFDYKELETFSFL